MKKIILFLFLIIAVNQTYCQQQQLESLKNELRIATADSTRISLIIAIGNIYFAIQPDSSLHYFKKGVDLIHKSSVSIGRSTILNRAGDAARILGDYPEALKYQFEALELARSRRSTEQVRNALQFIGNTYIEFGEYRQALSYFNQSILLDTILVKEANDPSIVLDNGYALLSIGRCYSSLQLYDSALHYLRLASSAFGENTIHEHAYIMLLAEMGNVFHVLGKNDSAMFYLRFGLKKVEIAGGSIHHSRVLLRLAEISREKNMIDSSFYFARAMLKEAQRTFQRLRIMEAATLLQNLHLENNGIDSAYYYQKMAIDMKDSLYGPARYKQLQLLMLAEQEREQKALQEQERERNRTRTIALVAFLGIFLVIIFLLFRNNRIKQKAKSRIEQAYTNLKETQNQLIHAEKMASLGELTVGIAHEIQNPLNFVNNFSELNVELFGELEAAVASGDTDEVQALVKDIKDNEGKINQHGKRAGAIVRGMLQHSRTNTGKKEMTDINALCNEYLRLAYHGYRAKDESFTAKFENDFDSTLPTINVVPQDMGRVILNLINNACYAVIEKQKNAEEKYEPTVTVATRKLDGKVEIKVTDNGNGIPTAIKEKIFQPFFTTKPAGLGTGLGLSLSYDTVKAHGGELKMETEEGHGTSFTIQLTL